MVVHPGKAKASDRTKRLRRRMGLVVARRITFEFTGLRGFSRRSGGMMGWATVGYYHRRPASADF